VPDVETRRADVLVIGGGMAGAFAALKARAAGLDVLLVDKAFFGRSGCSALASGVYPTYMPGDREEDWLKAFGGPLVNQPLLRRSLPVMYEHLMLMDRAGVKWVKRGRDIVRLGGPGRSFESGALMGEGGPQMMMAVRNAVVSRGVRVVNRFMLTDLITSDGRLPTTGRVVGAVGFGTRTGQPAAILARAVVMCTGPYKFPYPHPGSHYGYMPIDLSGDGIAAMLRAGAVLSRLELGGIQIHSENLLCAPGLESLMPSGAQFLNADGRRLLEAYDPQRLELTSRALLYFAIGTEYLRGQGPAIDLSQLGQDQVELLRHVIPIIITSFERAGFDLTRDRIPYTYQVAATSGIFGAGARVTERGETSLPGLFAAGTCSDMAYLPGGHLSFVSASGEWAGDGVIADLSRDRPAPDAEVMRDVIERLAARAVAPLDRPAGLGHGEVRARLGRILDEDVGFVLAADRLDRAIDRVRAIIAEDLGRLTARDPHDLAKVWGVVHYAEVLEAILGAYRHRRESRVAFMREDYPDIDNVDWLRFVLVQRRDGALHTWDEPIPPSFHLTPPRRTRNRHLAFRVRAGGPS
jgi:succinate dehydrogenase/fumarate reductase flavoprotein subunit